MELRDTLSRPQAPRVVLFEALGCASSERCAALREQGYVVDWIHDVGALLELPLDEYQLALIQWRAAGEPRGLALARQLRSKNGRLGIVMLDDAADPAERRRALDELVDDCLDATCDTAELLARVKALARRIGRAVEHDGVMDLGPVRVDFTGGFASIDGEEISLQPLQLRILGFLLKNAGRTVTHEELRRHVFRVAQATSSTSLPRQVSVLRKRLGAAGHLIVTCPGGYSIGMRPGANGDPASRTRRRGEATPSGA